jgi:hypothetical protein
MAILLDLFRADGVNFTFVKMLTPAFMAILFLQSGLNKLLDYNGNLSYFTDYFKNSSLRSVVSLMMPIITVLEVAAGILSAYGVVALFSGNEIWAFWGLITSALSIICLFFGQRMAKDYGAASGMTGYFIVNLIGLLLLL